MSVADKGQVLFLNFNYVEELEMSCDFWQLLLYVFVLCLRISTACPVTWYHCLVLVSESAHCSPAPWLFLYCSFFSRFVPLGNWWHESTVTDCRSCCDLSTMWPILIRPVVFVISLELKNLRVYFWTNGLKKKRKARTNFQYTSIWLTYTDTDSQNCHGLKMPETGLCISCKLWVREKGAKVALNCCDTTMQTMQFHFQRCKARGSLKVSLGREIIAALHDCAKYR